MTILETPLADLLFNRDKIAQVAAEIGKSDTLDAIAAAQAALARRRASIPKSRDGRVESLRVLKLTRATVIRARTKAVQLLRHHIVSAPEELRDQVRNLTRMQLIRTCAAWRPDTIGYRDPAVLPGSR